LRRFAKEKVMIKFRNVAALLALSSVAALPACSMFGGNTSSQQSSASASQSPAVSQAMVQQVQTRLQQAGTYSGRIDGLWGPETEAAVRSYQQQHNLNATGQLDSNTLASLNLGGTNQTVGSTPPAAAEPPVANTPPAASAQPVASAPTVASTQSTGNTPPPSQVDGAGNTAPSNTNIPPGNAAQPDASTTH
jgi:peptidoglycan hydrolase-like protein with peptidoglycan-binding domain